ncbi:hypothetical protein FIU90_13400 [Erythrobacter sp. THAF29]|nr:hypothetical protein FIU90_13400 [Erythrobacter sp. THAF29]
MALARPVHCPSCGAVLSFHRSLYAIMSAALLVISFFVYMSVSGNILELAVMLPVTAIVLLLFSLVCPVQSEKLKNDR